MNGTKGKRDFGQFSLLFSELSMIVFLFWALTVEGGKQERKSTIFERAPALFSSNTFARHTNSPKELSMLNPPHTDKEVHVEVHIDLCPNDVLHIKIGNICLHLCRQDFLQLAQAVQHTAEHITRSRAVSKLPRDKVH
ncbi:MAG: hypothetical protein NZ578_10245 [Candidatus Binatia bacterium]|nr:hypothetical protein [Candidatus Binatia bacterium]